MVADSDQSLGHSARDPKGERRLVLGLDLSYQRDQLANFAFLDGHRPDGPCFGRVSFGVLLTRRKQQGDCEHMDCNPGQAASSIHMIVAWSHGAPSSASEIGR
jgi:prepilin-type processing-associated H-X9-DG protein